MTKDFLQAFGMIIRDQIIMKNSVEIEGLGTFSVKHRNQKQEKRADGKTVMLPPKDGIEFKAENAGGGS
jgi:nucleoid DNA-binding protein